METPLQLTVGRLLNQNLAPNKLCVLASTLLSHKVLSESSEKEASNQASYGDNFPRGQLQLDRST